MFSRWASQAPSKPSALESAIPIWGSIREADYHFYHGHYGLAFFHAFMTGVDVVAVGGLAKSAGKLAVKGGASAWAKIEARQAAARVGRPLWTSTPARTAIQNAYKHFLDHGADFGARNALDYARKAHRFLHNPPPFTQTIIRGTGPRAGDVLRYNPVTGTFGVMDAAGAPRTMFKPVEGIQYWYRQL
jgi:filamentous hemagglutinin